MTFSLLLLQFNRDSDMPSDAQRIQKVKVLVEAGYSHRIMLAHDIHSKHRLVSLSTHVHMYISPGYSKNLHFLAVLNETH